MSKLQILEYDEEIDDYKVTKSIDIGDFINGIIESDNVEDIGIFEDNNLSIFINNREVSS